MTVHLRDVVAYLDATLEIDRFKDYAPNGLQVEGRPQAKVGEGEILRRIPFHAADHSRRRIPLLWPIRGRRCDDAFRRR